MMDTMVLRTADITTETDLNGDFLKDGLLHCGVCGEPKERLFSGGQLLPGLKLYKHPVMCACERKARETEERRLLEQKHESEVQRLKEKCFDHRIMGSWTFERSILDDQKLKIGRKYVENWPDVLQKDLGLLLWGKVGTGKTYFAASIANALLHKEVPVRMTNLAAIMNCRYEERSDLIKSFRQYDLLIIDDFGMERDTSFGMETVYQVIDGRYLDHKPLILTTNLSLEALKNPPDIDHRRIYDRVLEMTTGVRFLGANLREVQSKARKETLDQILK